MSDHHSFKKRARQHQQATGDSYTRARRQVDRDHAGAAADPGRGHNVAALPPLATAPRMLSLLGIDHSAPDITALWAAHQLPVGTNSRVDLGPLLRVPLGLRAGGEPVWLDLKEQGTGGDGPHGLLVGAEGSGKSTTLQTILVALCAQHAPDLLQLVLLDGQELSCFADFGDYPHTAAILDTAPAATAAVQDLIDQRHETLRGHRDIREYNELRATAAGSDLPAVPYTLVVVDELPVLLRDDPDFTRVLTRLFQEGRSLGIHVLLAGTHLDPFAADAYRAIDRRFAANARYRIALRAETGESSHRAIGTEAAYHLPTSPGLGLFLPNLRADPVPYRGFQISRDLVRRLGRRPDADGS